MRLSPSTRDRTGTAPTARGLAALAVAALVAILLGAAACNGPPTRANGPVDSATLGVASGEDPVAHAAASPADETVALVAGIPQRAPAGTAASDTAVAFVDVNVVPMADDWVLPHHTVVVRGGRIESIAPSETAVVPDGVLIIDGSGRYLMPGLADMHVHTWSANDFALFLANGVTTVRNMFGAPLHLEWKESIEKGELVAPTIVTSGPIIDGNPAIWNGSDVVETKAQAAATVANQQATGYDFLKVYSNLTPEAYHAVADRARELGLTFAGHVPREVPLRDALAAGQASIEHLTGFGQALARQPDADVDFWHVLDDIELDRLPALAREVAESGTWQCPTLVVWGGFARPEIMRARLEDPVMQFVDPTTRAMWNPDADFRTRGRSESDYDAMRRGDDVRLAIVEALHEAGAPLLLGTDTPNPLVVPGFSIHEELALLVEAGLTPYEALRAGTVDAARFLDQVGEFGVVAPGARADLLLVRANPLQDVANVSELSGVMLRGAWLPEGELQRALHELSKGYSADVDRFLGMPSLPLQGEKLEYELSFNGQSFASERSRANLTDEDQLDVVCQLVYDPPIEIGLHLHMLLEPRSTDTLIDALVRTPVGEGRALLERGQGRLRITGTGIYADLGVDRALGNEVLLQLGPLGVEQHLLGTLATMEHGEAIDLARLSVDFDVEITLKETLLTVERLDDVTIETAEGALDVAAYRLDSRAVDGSGAVESTLYLDADGRAVRLEQLDQMGIIRLERTGTS